MNRAMELVYLGLGSNQGDRQLNLDNALQAIGSLPQTSLAKVSSVIETKAEGFDGADFLNCCCSIETGLGPMELLEALKKIESAMGREVRQARYDSEGRRIYSDRPIDIDILLYGSINMNEEKLQIPHPRMLERDFVMIPLNEIRNNQKI